MLLSYLSPLFLKHHSDGNRKNIIPILERGKKGFLDLHVDQPPLNPLDIYRANLKVISKHV